MSEQKVVAVREDVARVVAEIEALIGKGPASRVIGHPGGVEVLHSSDDLRFPALLGRPLGADCARKLFYSALARAISTTGWDTARVEDWRGFLQGLTRKGVKADEIEWSGVSGWLAQRDGRITKQEILAYLERHTPRIQVVELYEAKDIACQLSAATAEAGYTVEHDPIDDQFLFIDEDGDLLDFQELPKDIQSVVAAASANAPEAARYADKTLPGGSNYRELLLTLPPGAAYTVAQRNAEGEKVWAVVDSAGRIASGTSCFALEHSAREEARQMNRERGNNAFLSGHWATPNVVAHIRVSDRLKPAGQRTLFVEEIQSDWGQALRSRTSGRTVAGDKSAEVPDAPFVRSTSRWLGLALKQVLAVAVTEKYDQVEFISGQQSADRYALDGAARAGMLGFYDDIVPKAVKSLLVRMGAVMQNQGAERASSADGGFVVSPELAASVRAGMPQFSVGLLGVQAMHLPAKRTTYLFADRIAHGHERAVFLHEIMHSNGPAVLGKREIQRLAHQVLNWSECAHGTLERQVKERALKRVDDAVSNASPHFAEELIAYAVEEAVLLGVAPDVDASAGTVEAWMHDTATTLRGALFSATAGGLPSLSVQDLVNMAYGLAQLKTRGTTRDNECEADYCRNSARSSSTAVL